MNLVIVESPSKTKTIKQFLGKDYDVVATKGHIRDIEDTGIENLGLDQNNNYKPIYAVIPKQQATIKMLNEYVKKADKVYLATDPDREGEAISWHLNQVLNLEGKTVKRITFNEITESAVLNAINNPRDIDENLFEAQETRKIIDRIIGYKLSTVLKRRIGSEGDSKVSAGRVQSACLKMITDREDAIKSFVPVKYYQIEADFGDFKAKLLEPGKKNQWQIDDEAKANEILSSLDEYFIVSSEEKGKRYEKATAPYTTSTLIQESLYKCNLNSKKTMKIAQELYEGIEVNGKHIAFISYMRTDSTRLSEEFKSHLVGYIINTYGKEYLGYAHTYNNNKAIQDGHEAIRPVSLYQTPEKVKSYLNPDQFKLYTLIFNHTVESMMKDSEIETKTVTLLNNDYSFSTTFEKRVFDGFTKVRGADKEEASEFKYELGEALKPKKAPELLSKETEGPKRFTEATIIKEMESSGIGRPSTYSSTIETIKSRKYVQVDKKKKIEPTEQGNIVSGFLSSNYGEYINVEYTAEMEKELDDIAEGKKEESEIVPSFYKSFSDYVKKQNPGSVETGELCPNCGSPMVYRTNRYGRFEACSNYPACKYIKKPEVEKTPEIECPECHKGHLIQRISRYGSKPGKKFYGCSNYPACKFTISTLKDLGIKK